MKFYFYVCLSAKVIIIKFSHSLNARKITINNLLSLNYNKYKTIESGIQKK